MSVGIHAAKKVLMSSGVSLVSFTDFLAVFISQSCNLLHWTAC